jgi:tetratricopeptide (TPR) repeat protein
MSPDQTAASEGTARPATGTRHLTIEHYESIGRISGALAQHAEEILKSLPGLEHVVERVFRSLAEVDKEGRAIRRALPFAQLCGESGESDESVRRVVDRFRADDCSFLVPSLSSAPLLKPDSRVDVGHEALLRRWERAKEWLQAEAHDGEQYRRLLSRADNERDVLPIKIVKDRVQWWKGQPRTSAWADRYGGGLERVDRLINDSLRRKRLIVRSAIALGCLVVIGSQLAWLGYANYRQRVEKAETDRKIERLEKEQQTALAEKNYQIAVASAKRFVDQVGESLNYGTVSVKGAKDLLKTVENNLDQVEAVRRTPETAEAAVNLDLAMADIYSALGDLDRAHQTAKAAKELAEPFLKNDPDNRKFLLLAYGASWRMGDALADRGSDRAVLLQALQEYQGAMALAERSAALAPDSGARKRDLMFVHQKIGDIRLQQGNWDGAVDEYRAGLAFIQSVVEREPDNPDWRREHANTMSRLGQAFTAKRDFAAALKNYLAAFETRTALAAADPNNEVLQSNVAASYVEFGRLHERLNDLDAALTNYKKALEVRERLARKDPENANWRVSLAPLYTSIGGVLRKKDDLDGSLQHYGNALRMREELALRDRTNPSRQEAVALALVSVADLLVARNDTNEALRHYSAALQNLEELIKQRPDTPKYQQQMFAGRIKVGDALLLQQHRDDGLRAYQTALDMARRLADNDPGNVSWQRNILAAYIKVGDALALTEEDRNQAIESYKTALARAQELAAKYPNNAFFAAQPALLRKKIQDLEPQLATEPRP